MDYHIIQKAVEHRASIDDAYTHRQLKVSPKLNCLRKSRKEFIETLRGLRHTAFHHRKKMDSHMINIFLDMKREGIATGALVKFCQLFGYEDLIGWAQMQTLSLNQVSLAVAWRSTL